MVLILIFSVYITVTFHVDFSYHILESRVNTLIYQLNLIAAFFFFYYSLFELHILYTSFSTDQGTEEKTYMDISVYFIRLLYFPFFFWIVLTTLAV
jgi:hypothetical protein